MLPLLSQAKEVCEPNVNSCGFYLCQEKKYSCGPKGYQLGFGFKFCQIYLDSEQNYSPAAYQWLRRVRVCLMQQYAQVESHSTQRSCGEIKADSFHSHVGCYVDTGFCELSGLDYIQIFWAMKSSARHAEIYKDAQGIFKACAFRKGPSPEALSAQR